LCHVVGGAASARGVREGLPHARFQNILRISSKTRKIRKIKLFLHLDMPSGKRGGTLFPLAINMSQNTLPQPTLTDVSHKHVLGK
jgi:hypothetical protein